MLPTIFAYSHRRRAQSYLLRDVFTTAEAAPIASPRTCEPGPGTLTLTNTTTGGAISIASTKLAFTRPSDGQNYNAYGFVATAGWARVTGRTLYGVLQSTVMDRHQFGLRKASSLNQVDTGILVGGSSDLSVRTTSQTVNVGSSLTANTDYQVAIVLRGTGEALFIRGGSQYPSWALLWVGAIDTYLNFFPALANFNSDVRVDELALLDKGGAFTTDYGLASTLSVIPADGETATSAADGLVYLTWTVVANETLIIRFRRTDDDNCYRLECAQAGGTIKLFRRQAASDTELDSGKTQTWTAGSQYRIGVTFAGSEIRTFVETTTPVTAAKHVATSQTFNQSATGVKVSGFTAAANLEIYPRTFSGTDGVTLA